MLDLYMTGWRSAYHAGKFNEKFRGNEEYERGFSAGMDAFDRW